MRTLGLLLVLAAAAPAAAQEQEAKQAFKFEDFELFARRNPFSPTPERKPATPSKKPDPKPDPKPEKKRETRDEVTKNLTVTSVMMSKNGSTLPVAIVEEEGEKPRHVREGDTFLKGKVTAVSMDGITVLVEGQARVIALGEAFADGTKTHKVYVDTGEPVDGPAKSAAGSSSSSSDSGDSSSKKSGGVSSLLSDEERKLPAAERMKLLRERMKQRSQKERKN